MGESGRILVVENEPYICDYLLTNLKSDSFQVETAATGREALDRLQKEPPPDLIFLENLLPDMDGLEVLKRLRESQPTLKVIMFSGPCQPRMVMRALHLGALDYLSEPIRKSELQSVVSRILDNHIRPGNGSGPTFQNENIGNNTTLVVASNEMRRIREQAALIATADVPVLLLGESGTGKGAVAQLIHKLSRRARNTFLKVNCAALPSELLESELFGYEAGAFTGATKSKPGKFELADKGTILLDEIGDMPIGLQGKLLHVLQDQEFFRLGGQSSIRVDTRVIAATNLDIKGAVASAKIRADLYYRLNAFTITLPPLRERRIIIPLLMKHFMAQFAAQYGREPREFSGRLLKAGTHYTWPGNVRELENFVRRYLIIGDEADALRDIEASQPETSEQAIASRHNGSNGSDSPNDLKSFVGDLKSGAEAHAISDILDQTNWNRKEAARRLNISYKALLNKIQKYSLDRDSHPTALS